MVENKRNFFLLTSIAVIIAIVNVLYRANPFFGYGLIAIEIAVLLFTAFKGELCKYASWYIIFVCNCMEFAEFSQETLFYNLKDVRFAGINLAALLLIPLLIMSVTKPIKIGKLRNEEPLFTKYGFGLLKLNIIALIVGAVLLVFNDNNIQGLSDNVILLFLKEVYSLFWIPLVAIIGFAQAITYERTKINTIYIALQAVIFGCWVQLIISLAFGIRGHYGGIDNTLVVSSISMLFPLFILLNTNKNALFYPRFTSIICITGTIILLLFNTSGKTIVFAAVAVLIYIFSKIKRITIKSITIIFFIVTALFIGVPIALKTLLSSSLLFEIKYEQALSLINIFSDTWRINMHVSPRSRLEEIIDILIEFYNKPWLIITGKGYMGSITDLTGFFSGFAENRTFVSADEWRNGTYYHLHEIASNLLRFGAIGVKYSYDLVRSSIKQFNNNPWIAIGTIWFLLIFGYSFTLSIFGVFSFLVALISIDNYVAVVARQPFGKKRII